MVSLMKIPFYSRTSWKFKDFKLIDKTITNIPNTPRYIMQVKEAYEVILDQNLNQIIKFI